MYLLRLTFRFQLTSGKTICESSSTSSRIGRASPKRAVDFTRALELDLEVGGRNNLGEIDCQSNVAGWVRSSDDAMILAEELPKRQN
jgi:riboflavin synthase alpha subunit